MCPIPPPPQPHTSTLSPCSIAPTPVTPAPSTPLDLPSALLQDLELLLDQSFDTFLAQVLPSNSTPSIPPSSHLRYLTACLSAHLRYLTACLSAHLTACPTLCPPSPSPRAATHPTCTVPVAPANFKLAHINSRSLVGHATEIADYIFQHDLDLLAISETWLHPAAGHAAQLATPDGYSILRADRIAPSVGGGVALIYRNSFDIHQVPLPFIEGCDLLLAKALINSNTSISFLIGYRPPPAMPEFEEQFLALLANLISATSKVLILGDLNYWAYDPTDKAAASLLDALDALGFAQHVKVPTHERGHILDWTLTLNLTLFDLCVRECPWSDHHMVSFKLEFPSKPQRADTIPRPTCISRNLRNVTPHAFSALASPLLAALPDSDDPAVLAEQFLSTTSLIMDRLAPEKLKKVKPETRNKTWFGDEVLAARTRKRAAEDTWRSTKDTESKAAYKTAAAQYKATILLAKKSLYDDRIKNAQSSSKELFKIVKELEGTTIVADKTPRDDSWCQSIQDALFAKVSGHRILIADKLAAASAGPAIPTPPDSPVPSYPPLLLHAGVYQ